MNETLKLGNEKILKLLLKYSIPAIVGMLINAIYNIVDRIFIGNSPDLGSLGIGGISITFPIFCFIMGVAILFGNGGAILFSTYLGEKKEAQAKKVLGISTTLIILSSIIITVVGLIFIDPILRFFGANGLLFDYAKQYISIILLGTIFQSFSLGMNYFVRADGHPRTSMITMLLGAVINIILDPILIFGFNMGMYGAAIATVIGQIASSIWVLSHFLSKRCHYKIEKKNMILQSSLVKLIAAYGLSSFIIQMANSLLNIVLNKSLTNYGGDMAVSVMGIIGSISTLLVLPILGLVQGAQPIISYNKGANQPNRILQTVKITIGLSTIFSLLSYAVIFAFPTQIIGLFNNEPELLQLGIHAMTLWFLALPVVGAQIVGSNYFQSVGKIKIAIFLTLTRQILFLIPLILVFGKWFGLDGILRAMPIADVLAFIVTMTILIREYYKHYRFLKKESNEKAIETNP